MFICSGESVNSNSTGNKEEQYISSKSVKGFKIDLRFIYDTEEDKYDVGAGEAAKLNNNDGKLFKDLGKVIRESKDVLDGFLNIVMEDSIAKSLSAWFVQIFGPQGGIASVHLACNGLYVAIPQGELKFPASIATMSDFLETFSYMLLFVVSNIYKKKTNKKNDKLTYPLSLFFNFVVKIRKIWY